MQWGAWLGGGMADGALAARLDRIGLGALQPGEGLCALSSLLVHLDGPSGIRSDVASVVTVNPFRWGRFLEQLPSVPPLPWRRPSCPVPLSASATCRLRQWH